MIKFEKTKSFINKHANGQIIVLTHCMSTSVDLAARGTPLQVVGQNKSGVQVSAARSLVTHQFFLKKQHKTLYVAHFEFFVSAIPTPRSTTNEGFQQVAGYKIAP